MKGAAHHDRRGKAEPIVHSVERFPEEAPGSDERKELLGSFVCRKGPQAGASAPAQDNRNDEAIGCSRSSGGTVILCFRRRNIDFRERGKCSLIFELHIPPQLITSQFQAASMGESEPFSPKCRHPDTSQLQTLRARLPFSVIQQGKKRANNTKR